MLKACFNNDVSNVEATLQILIRNSGRAADCLNLLNHFPHCNEQTWLCVFKYIADSTSEDAIIQAHKVLEEHAEHIIESDDKVKLWMMLASAWHHCSVKSTWNLLQHGPDKVAGGFFNTLESKYDASRDFSPDSFASSRECFISVQKA